MGADVKIIINGVDKFSSVMNKPIKVLDNIGKKSVQVGKSLTKNVTLPIVAIGAASLKMSTDINKSMGNVQTLLSGGLAETTTRAKAYKKEVQSLAVDVGKFPKDVGGGLFEVISSFGEGPEIMDKLRINAKAAVGGLASTTEAIDLTAGVTKAYGDVTLEATQKVADLAFKTNELGKTTFPEMASSMGKIAPLGSQLSVSMNELFGVIATGTGVTGNTAEVSTQLSSIFSALLKPTVDMEIAFKKLNVTSGKDLIQKKGLAGSLKALQDLSEKYNVRLGKLLGSKEALNLALTLNGELSETFAKKMILLEDSAGSAEKAFQKQTQGINKAGFAWSKFLVKINVVAANIGDKLSPVLIDLGQKYIKPLIDKLLSLDDKKLKLIVTIALVVASVGPLLIVFGKLLTSIKLIATAFTVLSFVMKGLFLNPVGLVILAVGLLGFGIFKLLQYIDEGKIGFREFGKTILRFFVPGLDAILLVMDPLLEKFELLQNLWNGFKTTGLKFGDKLKDFFLPSVEKEDLLLKPEDGKDGANGISQNNIINNIVNSQQSKFNGVLKIEGVPPKSQLEVSESGGLDVEIDSGLIQVGVGG